MSKWTPDDTTGGDDIPQSTTGTDEEESTGYGNEVGEDSERVLEADLLPGFSSDTDDGAVDIKIYIVTGRHGPFRLPERFCRECHMFTRRADAGAEHIDADVNVHVLSWWTHFPWALLHGGYHPPVMVVGDSKLCQGHNVPTSDEVVAAIKAELNK